MNASRVGLAAILGLTLGLVGTTSARAQAVEQAPTITLDRAALKPGERVLVTLTGWRSQVVTVAVCGNLAKRGSSDCNMAASQAFGIARGAGTALAQLTVPGPPTSCPCVIRASSSAQAEVALAPIDLIGVPVGPLVDPTAESPVVISLETRRVRGGLIKAFRSALGGPTVYDVTISIRNRSPELLPSVALWGSVGRSRTDELVSFLLPSSGELAPGATWTGTERVRLPAPVLGTYVWRAGAAGGGSIGQVEKVSSLFPKALPLLGMVLLVDLAAMAWRRRARRKALRVITVDGPLIDLREARPGVPASPRARPVAPALFDPPGSRH